MFIARHLLPARHRAVFLICFVVARLLALGAEYVLFGEAPPAWVALIVTVAMYAAFYLAGRLLGLYEPLPDENEPVASR